MNKKTSSDHNMSKSLFALVIVVLLVLCTPALSGDLDLDSSHDLDAQSQLQMLETEVAQISLSEKELREIVELQQGGDPLTDQEKETMAKLAALQQRQEKGMLKDEDFDFPLQLLKHHTKCNAQIIEAVLAIVRTAKMQVHNM
jgi:hypothetical protein